jgi:hypothetical protein
MLPKVVFDKTLLVKFKVSNNSKQNIDETDSKQPKIHRKIHSSSEILKVSRKKSANQKSGYGFKNLYKIYMLAYGFLFFVISISGRHPHPHQHERLHQGGAQ